MEQDLQELYDLLNNAAHPEDVFGNVGLVVPESTLLQQIDVLYARMKAVTAARHELADQAYASDADARLEQLYSLARELVSARLYGIGGGEQRPPHGAATFDIGPNRYFIGRRLPDGPHSRRYVGHVERRGVLRGRVLLKLAGGASLAEIASNNAALQREVRNLDALHEQQNNLWSHFPQVIDRFLSNGRSGLVLRATSGYTLEEVHSDPLHRNGIDSRDMVWMLDRLLRALVHVHTSGIVHGALQPASVVIQPDSHNVVITGWSAAAYSPAISGEQIAAPTDTPFCAPELKRAGRIGPWTDVFSVGKLMIYLLGGDIQSNELPPSLEPQISRFLLEMVKDDEFARPDDAYELYVRQNQLKDELWPRVLEPHTGEMRRVWRNFPMSS